MINFIRILSFLLFFLSLGIKRSSCLDKDLLSKNGSIVGAGSKNLFNSSYAPYSVLCPSTSLIRRADNQLCPEEAKYIAKRQATTEKALETFFSTINIPNFSYSNFTSRIHKPITISIALSGGGYRSMLTGSGVLAAYDERTPCSNISCGGLGSLLQGTSYFGGISGGAWLVMSSFINDFRPVYELLFDDKTWTLQQQLLEGIPSFDPSSVREGMLLEDETLLPIEMIRVNKTTSTPNLESNWGIADIVLKFFGLGKLQTETNGTTEKSTQSSSYLESIIKPMFVRKNNETRTGTETKLKNAFAFFKDLQIEVRSKKTAGFYISFTDYWGRALARKIFQRLARTPGATITSTTYLPSFQNHQQPFPVVCSVQKLLEDNGTPILPHIFEFTPFEFGSWDFYLNAFMKIRYLGTSMYDGFSIHTTENPNISICTSGFDNIGFVTGTSSSLFNHIFVYLYQVIVKANSDALNGFSKILDKLGLNSSLKSVKYPHHSDYALYSPNPFYEYKGTVGEGLRISKSQHLYLADGGDGGENIPFHSFLTKSRKVDIIFAYDMSSDKSNYPNGTTLRASSKRYHDPGLNTPSFDLKVNCESPGNRFDKMNYNQSKTSQQTYCRKALFPHVPSPEMILNDNLNARPIFLGCDIHRDYPELPVPLNSTEMKANNSSFACSSDDEGYLPPIIVYTANYNHSFDSNRSTFQLSYTTDEALGMVENGYNLATYKNSSDYSICVGCAILKRSFDRIKYSQATNNIVVPSACEECYSRYCFHNKS